MVVAAIAEANDRIMVTDNERHFSGVRLLNPSASGDAGNRSSANCFYARSLLGVVCGSLVSRRWE